MKTSKYKLITSNNLKNNNDYKAYNIIVILRFFDSYVLIHDNARYDHIRFSTSDLVDETIINKVEKILKFKPKLTYKGALEEKKSKDIFHIYMITIDSMELKKIKEMFDVKIYSKMSLKENYNNNEIYDITDFFRDEYGFGLMFIFIIIPIITIIIALSILIYNIINGKIIFELLFGLILFVLIVLYGFYKYKTSK